MKYLKFDCEQLARDYNKNKDTIKALQVQIYALSKKLENPFIEARGDSEVLMAHYESQLQEYQEYVALVDLGLDGLCEQEREIIKNYYILGMKVEDITNKMFISRAVYFVKKVNALKTFSMIVFPV